MKKVLFLVVIFSSLSLSPTFAATKSIESVGSVFLDWAGTDSTQKYVLDGGNDLVYFYDGYYNIFSVDVSDPTNPTEVGSINLGGSPGLERRIARSGDYLYVPRSGVGNADMDIVNVSDPTSPTLSGSLSGSTVRNLYVEGSKLYATGDGKLKVYDISSPAAPSLEWTSGTLPTDIAFDMAVKNGYAYVVGEGTGKPLTIVNTSNQSVSSITLNSFANRAVVLGDVLYVGLRDDNLTSYDISSPGSPTPLSTFPTNPAANNITMTASGNYLYIGSLEGKLEGVDISDPSAMHQFATFDGLNTWDIFSKGNYLYASSNEGLQVLTVTPEPASMALFGIGATALGVARRRKSKKSKKSA